MIILHGEDISASRKKLVEIIAKAKLDDLEIFEFGSENINLTYLMQAIESQSLFGQQRLIVIEGLVKLSDAIKKYLANQSQSNIVVWEGKKLSAAQIKQLGNSQAQEFKLPQLLFTFLDGVGIRDRISLMKLLEELLVQQNGDLVFALYHRRLRHLLLVANKVNEMLTIEKLAGWQLGKLSNQARKIGTEKIKDKYQECFEYDLARKKGKTSMDINRKLIQWIGNW